MLLLVNKVYFSPLAAKLPDLCGKSPEGTLGWLEHTLFLLSLQTTYLLSNPFSWPLLMEQYGLSFSEGLCPLNLVLSLTSEWYSSHSPS